MARANEAVDPPAASRPAKGSCYACGKTGHFIKECRAWKKYLRARRSRQLASEQRRNQDGRITGTNRRGT